MGNCCSEKASHRQAGLEAKYAQPVHHRAVAEAGAEAAKDAASRGALLIPGMPVVVRGANDVETKGNVSAIRGELLDVVIEDNSLLEGVSINQVVKQYPIWHLGDRVLVDGQPATICQVMSLGHRFLLADEGGTMIEAPVDNISSTSIVNDLSYPITRRPRIAGLYEISVVRARGLPKTDRTAKMAKCEGDPFCLVIDCHDRVVTKTRVVNKSCDPEWNHTVTVSLGDTDKLHFWIRDKDVTSDDNMCECMLTFSNGLGTLADGVPWMGWLELHPCSKKYKEGGSILVKVRPLDVVPGHTVCSSLELWRGAHVARRGGRVVLYQSAHIGEWADKLAPLTVYQGSEGYDREGKLFKEYADPQYQWQFEDNQKPAGPVPYIRRDCWVELFTALLEAKKFIYVMGWSVNVNLRLLREDRHILKNYPEFEQYGKKDDTITVGELLRWKADHGVAVTVMVWGEATSISGVSEGMAGTGSGQTFAYFSPTKVAVRAMERKGGDLSTNYVITHHQKGIICDAPQLSPEIVSAAGAKRRVVAFMGGLDITGGRYDTPGKDLYGTLQTIHADDFYQNCVPLTGAPGTIFPRQPWQDIHLKLEGQAAYDIARNFEHRWMTQTAPENHSLVYGIFTKGDILKPEEDVVMDPDHPEAWDVQYFRSIDTYSDTHAKGVEADCARAWIAAIERSERFIYIENQYFMGSSQFWKSGKSDYTPVNCIPITIVERVRRAIKEGHNWTAYIIIPMFPEGLPDAAPMQEILHFQYKTMEMMYHEIGQALIAAGSQRTPEDYLNFYCLGNREPTTENVSIPPEPPRTKLVLTNRRMQIYVHSKMLIADDDYIIVGSANVNDRSMKGDRDTEMAVGCYQPAFSRARGNRQGCGMVGAFRRSLWTEHLGLRTDVPESPSVDSIIHPEHPACVSFVNKRAAQAWNEHAGDEHVSQLCHMMKYPIKVANNGEISVVQECFPDAPNAKVAGQASNFVPDYLTS